MDKLDAKEVERHINILNVAYHLNLEIIETRGNESKAICPFCGYNKVSKIPTLNLNYQNNKYHCVRCGVGGYSIGLYAKLRNIDTKKAYIELLQRDCFSINKAPIEISPINLISDIEKRDAVYRDFINMLKLESQHKRYLEELGFLNSSIDNGLYRTIPKNYIKRRLICSNLSRKYDLSGISGFFQEEDFKWCFSGYRGFFVPVINQNGYIEALSVHLDKQFNNTSDLWFSSSGKINGTSAKSAIMKSNIDEDTWHIVITDNLLLGNLIKETIDAPVIAFQKITNSYMILKEIEETNIQDISFVFRVPNLNENIDYIINRIFRDLIPIGYNLNIKYIRDYKDIFDEEFSVTYALNRVA